MSHKQLSARLWLVELIAWWEGRVTAGHLQSFFGIGRQQASRDIGQYLSDHPGNLTYDACLKGYRPTPGFRIHHIRGDVAEYLNWMTGMINTELPEDPRYRLNHTAISHPPRNVTPAIVRPLVQALRKRQRVDVDYVSVSNPDSDGRIIVPVAFVNTGLRWHLRAYCEKSAGYRDLVLSRFRGAPEPLGNPLAPLPPDTAWDTELTLILKPDPRLNPVQQSALMHDYGMADGELRLTTRAALANYLLLEMQVNVKMLDGDPAAQQLILANHADVKRWLF